MKRDSRLLALLTHPRPMDTMTGYEKIFQEYSEKQQNYLGDKTHCRLLECSRKDEETDKLPTNNILKELPIGRALARNF